MENLNTLIRFTGYIDLISPPKPITNIEIINDSPIQIITFNTRWYNKKDIRQILNIAYRIFALIMHCLVIGYIIIHAIDKRDFTIASSNSFQLIFVTQYILGVQYFNKDHFKKLVHYDAIPKKYVYGILILTLSLILATITALFLNIRVNLYTDLLTHSAKDIPIVLLLIIEKSYSLSVLFTNIVCFSFVFNHHKREIYEFLEQFQEILETDKRVNMTQIIADFSVVKSAHKTSVEALNNIFAGMIIVSIIATYLIFRDIRTDKIGFTQYFNIGIIGIGILLYCKIINDVKLTVGEIKSLINSETFQERYRDPRLIVNNESSPNENKLLDISVTIASAVAVTQTITEWSIIDKKLADEWEPFVIMGFEMDDATLLQRGTVLTGVLLMLLSLDI